MSVKIMIKASALGLIVCAAGTTVGLWTAGPAVAGVNLVVNGGFESLTGSANQFIGYGVSELIGWS